jgi:hypothetical protein
MYNLIDRKYLAVVSIISLFFLIAVTYPRLTGSETNYGTAPAYDSGWVNITAEAGQYITILHNLNSTEIVVDITGKTTIDGGVHQRNLGGTSYTQGWRKTYGGAKRDKAMSIVQTGDGGYAIAGHTRSYGAGGSDFWLVRTDSSGTLLWNRTYGGRGDDYCSSMVQTDDGFAITGYTKSYGAGDYDFWLVKTDSSGNALWNRTYGGEESEQAMSLIQTNDRGYVIAGNTESFGAGSSDCWLVKTDINGNLEWNQTYGEAGWEYAHCVIETSDEGYAITGGYQPVGADWSDFWLVKTDSAGNMEWNKTYGGPSEEFAYSLVQTVDGGYAIAGRTLYEYAHPPNYDFWLVKTDANGNMAWNKTYGRAYIDRAYSVLQTSDGGYAMVGRTQARDASGFLLVDFWVIKVDRSGNVQWNKTYGGANSDWAWSFVQTSDEGYTIAAYTDSFGVGDYDFWLIKTDVESGLVWTDSTADTITLYRGATDAYWNHVRVRIWKIKENP